MSIRVKTNLVIQLQPWLALDTKVPHKSLNVLSGNQLVI